MKIIKTAKYKESQNFYMDPEHVKEDWVPKRTPEPLKVYVSPAQVAREVEEAIRGDTRDPRERDRINSERREILKNVGKYLKGNPEASKDEVARIFDISPVVVSRIAKYFGFDLVD
jgi:hypothetical protein